MANERPSNHPLGYWLAGTPASAPAHAWPDWLLEILGRGFAPDPAGQPQETPQDAPTFPIPQFGPNGNILAGRGQPAMRPYNALRGWPNG